MTPSTTPTSSGVRCGNRAQHGEQVVYHASVAAVRECFALSGRFAGSQPDPERVEQWRQAPRVGAPAAPGSTAETPMTFEQFREANEFFDGEFNHEQEQAAYQRYLARFEYITADEWVSQARAQQDQRRAEFSAKVEETRDRHRAAARERYAAWRQIPVYAYGRAFYALEMGGEVHFFKVNRPVEGKFAGRTFVKEQAGDAFYQMPWPRTCEVLDAIAADPEAAQRLYGQHIGKCAHCGRTLTDPESREFGIGPECRKRAGV